jgi:hypothetical protein
MSMPRLAGKWSLRLLGAWLLAMAVLQLVPALSFSGSGVVLAVLGGAAGVLILLDRQPSTDGRDPGQTRD